MRKLTPGFNQYGAFMGRPVNMTEKSFPVKFHLVRLRLDAGGYDSGGAYWGNSDPLFWAYGDGAEEVQEMFFRAIDREDAKKHIRTYFPAARFYR